MSSYQVTAWFLNSVILGPEGLSLQFLGTFKPCAWRDLESKRFALVGITSSVD